MSGELVDNAPLELSDLINRVLDKGAVIAGSVTISVGDIDLIQLDLTVVLTAIETARSAERRRRELQGDAECRRTCTAFGVIVRDPRLLERCGRRDRARDPRVGTHGLGERRGGEGHANGGSREGTRHGVRCRAGRGETPLPVRFGQTFPDDASVVSESRRVSRYCGRDSRGSRVVSSCRLVVPRDCRFAE